MCGIIFIHGDVDHFGKYISNARRSIRHRGPDSSGTYIDNTVIMAFERLEIVGDNMVQPISNKDYITMTNGEFYQYHQFYSDYTPITNCDSEILIPLFMKYGSDLFKHIEHGKFASVIYDKLTSNYIVARDRIGIIPLYYAKYENTYLFASELKALEALNVDPIVFPPGHICVNGNFSQYATYWDNIKITNDTSMIRDMLIEATEMRIKPLIDNAVPFACLLSGGVDSSIIASIASEYCKSVGTKLSTYSVGFNDSSDLIAARNVAKYIDSDHTELIINRDDALITLPDTVYYLETYDITTIRAGTPMLMLARRIKADGFKVVLSGEGSDEMFGGYRYFKNAPSPDELQTEIKYKMMNLYKYDCLRANKALMAWGIEGRFPFLDNEFVDYIMSINPSLKMSNLEKKILRDQFVGFVPSDILYRKKEQFSDGVGHSWINALKSYADICLSFQDINYHDVFQYNTPWNNEGYYYRELFQCQFKSISSALTVPNEKSVACCSENALKWLDPNINIDPSGLL
jgi:asparagine synthase (glutamine-hydrolysing)